MRPNPLIATFTAIVFILYFGGRNFLKPMRDFSRERPPVNEDLGTILPKPRHFLRPAKWRSTRTAHKLAAGGQFRAGRSQSFSRDFTVVLSQTIRQQKARSCCNGAKNLKP